MKRLIVVGVLVPALLAAVAGLYVATRDDDVSRLTGNKVDPDPDHWKRLESHPVDVTLDAAALTAQSVLIVPDFPVSMNACDAGQTRVAWRALNGVKVAPGITSFLGPGMAPEDNGSFEEAAESGTMVMGNCEQPMWKLDGGDFRVVVEVGLYGPAVGDVDG